MNSLYETIEKYCALKGKTVGGMCSEIGISKGIFSSLKSGKSQSLSTKTLSKISEYLNVPIEVLLGENKTNEIDEEKLKRLALFGGSVEVTDEMWDEAMFAIELIKQRHARKKETNGEAAADSKEK